MAEASSHSSTVKRMEKSARTYTENIEMGSRKRESVLCEAEKENRVRKNSDGSGNVVKRIRMRYEELSNSRKYVAVHGTENVSTTGAVKKRIVANKPIESKEEKSVASKKHVTIREDDVFVKSRFKVYADKETKIRNESVGKKLAGPSRNGGTRETVGYAEERPQNRNVARIQLSTAPIASTVQPRFTPIDVPLVPVIPKKVKIQHRQSSMNTRERPNDLAISTSRSLTYKLPYDDDFIMLEMEKEKSMLGASRGFRQKNISVAQRKIIVKFLTRLHAHSFYPSALLYQTVRIFDAALDAKAIEVEELQLTALAAMWIALKREHTVYSLPSAAEMISFSNDLYEGKTELLRKCERDVIQSLKYEIVFPDPFSVLCYNITMFNGSDFIDENQIELAYYCGGYMIDLSLFDEDLMSTSAILLAAAAAETALYFILEEVKSGSAPVWSKWRAPHTAKRYSEHEISIVRSRLIEKISESSYRHTDGEIVFKKYSRSRYGKISRFLGSKVKLFLAPECSIIPKE